MTVLYKNFFFLLRKTVNVAKIFYLFLIQISLYDMGKGQFPSSSGFYVTTGLKVMAELSVGAVSLIELNCETFV